MRLVTADDSQALPVPIDDIDNHNDLLEKRDDQVLVPARDLMFTQAFLDLLAQNAVSDDQSRYIHFGVEACCWYHGFVLGVAFGPAGDAFGEEIAGFDVRGVAFEPAAVDLMEKIQHSWAH